MSLGPPHIPHRLDHDPTQTLAVGRSLQTQGVFPVIKEDKADCTL